jgi:hypothetical protein
MVIFGLLPAFDRLKIVRGDTGSMFRPGAFLEAPAGPDPICDRRLKFELERHVRKYPHRKDLDDIRMAYIHVTSNPKEMVKS